MARREAPTLRGQLESSRAPPYKDIKIKEKKKDGKEEEGDDAFLEE